MARTFRGIWRHEFGSREPSRAHRRRPTSGSEKGVHPCGLCDVANAKAPKSLCEVARSSRKATPKSDLRNLAYLFFGHGGEQQILVVPTEVGQRRNGLHPYLVDPSVGLEAEGDEGIFVTRGGEVRAEGVVLIMFERTDEAWRAVKADLQFLRHFADSDRAVPGIPVHAGVAGQG